MCTILAQSTWVKVEVGIDTDLQIGRTVFSCADGEEESCGQEVPFTYLQEQISNLTGGC